LVNGDSIVTGMWSCVFRLLSGDNMKIVCRQQRKRFSFKVLHVNTCCVMWPRYSRFL